MQTGKINCGSNWNLPAWLPVASCWIILSLRHFLCSFKWAVCAVISYFSWAVVKNHGFASAVNPERTLRLCWKSKCAFMFSSPQASGQVSEPSSLPPSLSSSTLPTLCRWEATEQPKVPPRCAIASPPSTKMSAAGCLLHLHTVERSCGLPWWSFS